MPKVLIDDKAFLALQIEAAFSGEKNLKATAIRLILAGISPRTKEALETKRPIEPKGLIVQKAKEPQKTEKDESTDVPKGTNEQGTVNLPLALSSDSLSAEEELVLQHLRLKTPYRKIETITGVSKSKVQTIAAKLEGMGLHQRRKPPKDKV